MRVAIIGSGISGLATAWLLHRQHQVTVYCADAHLGGHAHTARVTAHGESHDVDTGFAVFNRETYPNFVRLLEILGVGAVPTDMSFSVRCDRSRLEYCGTSLNTIFAQRGRLLDPGFHRMLRHVVRFNRGAACLLEDGALDDDLTLEALLDRFGMSARFRRHYILPMAAAIWSADPERVLGFPARFFVRFFQNHGLLGFRTQHQWYVIPGGSRRYVQKLTAGFAHRIRLRTPVRAVRRRPDAVDVSTDEGTERYDRVVLATHSDQALALLTDPSDAERDILGALPYQANEATVHTDGSQLPRRRRARASWNYRVTRDGGPVRLTYDLARLQHLAARRPLLLTLNGQRGIPDADRLLDVRYDHPFFTSRSAAAQGRLEEISGVRRTHFCGAYWGHGFHEDGLDSALAVGRHFGIGLEGALRPRARAG